jgi:Skp family chaperone for outer membrane proteins
VPVVGAKADGKPPVVAVVDLQLILHESTAGKAVQKAIESQGEIFHREISAQEEKLRQGQQDLERQHAALSEDAFAKKRRDFEKQVADYQRDAQARQKALQQGDTEASRTILGAINDILGTLAREKGINLVLPRPAVVFADTDLDVTQEVLSRLNSKLPSVAVNIPSVRK